MGNIIDFGKLKSEKNDDEPKNTQRRSSIERTKFLEDIKVETPGRGGINREFEQQESKRRHERTRQPRKYKAKKGTAEKAVYKQIKNPKSRLAAASLALAAALAVGGFAITSCANDKQAENGQIQTIEQAIDAGETLETLGLSQETVDKLAQFEEKLSKPAELSDTELVRLSQQIDEFALDSAKGKLIRELGLDENTNISFNYEQRTDTTGTNIVLDGKTYKDYFDFGSKLASSQMIKMVNNISSHQGKTTAGMKAIDEGQYIDRQSLVEKSQEFLKSHEEFLSGDISMDENQNLNYYDVREAQKLEQEKLEKQQEEQNKPKIPVTMVEKDDEGR